MTEAVHVVCPHCNTTNRVPQDAARQAPVVRQLQEAAVRRPPAGADRSQLRRARQPQRHSGRRRFLGRLVRALQDDGAAFAQAALEIEPRVRFAKLDTEAAQSIAARYGIRSIPTMIVFRHGKELARQSGAITRQCRALTPCRWVTPLVVGEQALPIHRRARLSARAVDITHTPSSSTSSTRSSRPRARPDRARRHHLRTRQRNRHRRREAHRIAAPPLNAGAATARRHATRPRAWRSSMRAPTACRPAPPPSPRRRATR